MPGTYLVEIDLPLPAVQDGARSHMTILVRKDMDRAKAEASLLVNVTSGMARERFITNIPWGRR